MSIRILVADDEPDVADLFRQRFRRDIREGRVQLDFASSAEEALRKAMGGEPPFMLLLSDINMPGMSGLDLLPHIKRELPGLSVLMITAYEDADTRRIAIERGADGLLSKPIDFGFLRAEIEARAAG